MTSVLYESAVNLENVEINEHDQIEDKIITSVIPEDLDSTFRFSCKIAWSIIKTNG